MSLPNNRIDHTDASPTSPIECALASLDFEAARLRMIPSARYRLYSADFLFAPM